MQNDAKKPLGPAASNGEGAQLPIAPELSDQTALAALIEGITDENRHDTTLTGPPVGREFW